MENIIEATASVVTDQEKRKSSKKVGCATCGAPVVKKGSFYCEKHNTVTAEAVEGDSLNFFEELINTFPENTGIKDIFTSAWRKVKPIKNNEEEEEMETNQMSVKSIGGATWDAIKEGAARVGSFVKKHAMKSLMGLGALTVGGLMTSSLVGAMVVGSLTYAAAAVAVKLIAAKRKKAEIDKKELVLGALGEAAIYTTLGGMSLYCLLGMTVTAFASLFVFSYIGYSYLGYLILV